MRLEEWISELKIELNTFESRIGELKDVIRVKEAEIDQHEQNREEWEMEMKNLSGQVDQRDANIANLKNEI